MIQGLTGPKFCSFNVSAAQSCKMWTFARSVKKQNNQKTPATDPWNQELDGAWHLAAVGGHLYHETLHALEQQLRSLKTPRDRHLLKQVWRKNSLFFFFNACFCKNVHIITVAAMYQAPIFMCLVLSQGLWWRSTFFHRTEKNSHKNHPHKLKCILQKTETTNLCHLVRQEQRDCEGLDVITETQADDVTDAKDGRVSWGDVPCAHCLIHHQVKHGVHLRQVGVLGQVEIPRVKLDS